VGVWFILSWTVVLEDYIWRGEERAGRGSQERRHKQKFGSRQSRSLSKLFLDQSRVELHLLTLRTMSTTRQLYGGAILANLPSSFLDAR